MTEKESTKSSILGPLKLSDEKQETSKNWTPICKKCPCVLCEKEFTLPLEEKVMLTHFLIQHKLVIADVHLIANLKGYVEYWKNSFTGYDLAEFCTTMVADETLDGKHTKNEQYYLLSDVLPKDYELRKRLREEKLQLTLTQYQLERTSKDYKRGCLFCRQDFQGTCSDFLKHLYEKHNLFLGNPHKLVYVDEMVNMIHDKMERLECLFCDKIFKDRNILKEHMRKKGHKRVNPNNKLFDRFYLSNYMNVSKNIVGKEINKPMSHPNSENDSDGSDWEEDTPSITCLFCLHSDTQYNNFLGHMKNFHTFDFEAAVKNLDFYQKVKLVNYIRRQMHVLQCVACDESFSSQDQLRSHMKTQNHYTVENKEVWDQPQYFFSTYDDDNLLWYLENDSQDWNEPELLPNIQEMYKEDLQEKLETNNKLNTA